MTKVQEYRNRTQNINIKFYPIEDYVNSSTKILHKCKQCGYKHYIQPNVVLRGGGCPVCGRSNQAIKGYTDINTTSPELSKLLYDYNDGYKYKEYSREKVYFKCPTCGKKLLKSIKDVRTQGLSCPMCSDGISYPNKFMYSFLSQIDNIFFEREKTFDWCHYNIDNKNRIGRYDFYVIKDMHEYIIEMDGLIGHGNKNYKGEYDETLIKIDTLKDKLAQQHNIDVIRIDCRYSDIRNRFEYLCNSIINSKLNEIFDLSNIDFEKCHEDSLSSIGYKCVLLWNEGKIVDDISNELKINRSTVIVNLKEFSDIGLCNYNQYLLEAK